MNYQAFEVFGTQHLITLFICAALILSYIKYFQNQAETQKVLGGKIVAIIIIIHITTVITYFANKSLAGLASLLTHCDHPQPCF